MPVTMEEVLALLDRDEPEYDEATKLGEEALPHLLTLVEAGEKGLASIAASLAGMIQSDRSVDVLESAAKSDEVIVRLAAAATLRNFTHAPVDHLLDALLGDDDAGVRRLSLRSAGPRARES